MLDSRQNILHSSFNLINKLSSRKAQSYFRFGFIIRFQMIAESQRALKELISKDGQGYQYSIIEANIHVNSFYINLMGAFDNLAWTFQYQFELFENITESQGDRQKIQLFGEKFLSEIDKKDSAFAKNIKQYGDWYKNIKNLRDPAAHRMPLYCPPAVINQEDLEKMQRLNAELEKIDITSDEANWRNKFYENITLGTYSPIFMLNGEENNKISLISETVTTEYEKFLSLSKLVVDWLEHHLPASSKKVH